MAGHSRAIIALAVTNFIMFLLNQVCGFLNMVDTTEVLGFKLFNTSIGDGSDSRYIEITPSSATFSIWGAIYIWQAVWMVYGLACMCRRTADGPVYTNPVLLTPTFYLVSILNWAIVITWTFTWSWGHVWVAFVCLALTFITIYICIGLSYKAIAENRDLLVKQGRSYEIWMVRAFVQNGLGIYGTWCTIATLLNLAMALSYGGYPDFEQSTSSTIALSILSVELVVFVTMDWIVLEKHMRYTITPYIVVIVALSGSITKNWNPMKTNSIFTAVLLAVASAGLVVKVVLMLLRHFRDSKKREEILPTIQTKGDASYRL